LKIVSPSVKMAVCGHCGASSIVAGNRATLYEEERIPLVDYPTRFEIGQELEIRGRKWVVQGYLDYRYSGGFWEEWWLVDEKGKEAWLQVDEGGFSLLEEKEKPEDFFEEAFKKEAKIGKCYEKGKRRFLVTHRVTEDGRIAYAKGNFPYVIKPEQPISYIEGILWKKDNPTFVCWEWDRDSQSYTEATFLFRKHIKVIREDSEGYDQPERFQRWAVRCPNCGGSLEILDPHTQYFGCQYCGSTLEEPTGKLELFRAEHGDRELQSVFAFQLGESIYLGSHVFQVVGRSLWNIQGEEFWKEYDDEEQKWERGIDRYSIHYPEYNLYHPEYGLVRMYKDDGKYYLYIKSLPHKSFSRLFFSHGEWRSAYRSLFSFLDLNGLERGKGELVYFDGESTYRKFIGQRYQFMDVDKVTSEALVEKEEVVEVEFYRSERCYPLREEEYNRKKAQLPRYRPSLGKEWPIYLGLLIGIWFFIKGCSSYQEVGSGVEVVKETLTIAKREMRVPSSALLQLEEKDSLFYSFFVQFAGDKPSLSDGEEGLEIVLSLNEPGTDQVYYAVRFLYDPHSEKFVPIQVIVNDSVTAVQYEKPFWVKWDQEDRFYAAPFIPNKTMKIQPVLISMAPKAMIGKTLEWGVTQWEVRNSIRNPENYTPSPVRYQNLGILWLLVFVTIFLYRRIRYSNLRRQVEFNL